MLAHPKVRTRERLACANLTVQARSPDQIVASQLTVLWIGRATSELDWNSLFEDLAIVRCSDRGDGECDFGETPQGPYNVIRF